MTKWTIKSKPTFLVLGAALTALFVVSLLVYTNRAAAQASSGNLLPPMTMVYEVYGPSISVGERSIEPFKELHRLEYQSETEWIDTVIESPSVDLGRYGVGSNVGSYTRLDGRAIDEYDAMDGSMEESAVSEDSIFVPNSAFFYALATPNSTDDTPGLSKSQVVSSATVCFNGDCEENARGVLYSGDGFELVMLMNDSWGIPLRLGDGFLVREIEIQVAKQ